MELVGCAGSNRGGKPALSDLSDLVTELKLMAVDMGSQFRGYFQSTHNVSKAKLSEYSEKIEALTAKLAASVPENEKPVIESREEEISEEIAKAESPISLSSGLRRRPAAHIEVRASHQERTGDMGAPIKLDAEAQAHIEKHRKLQEDLTDEMVELARQLKESSIMMNQSVEEREKLFAPCSNLKKNEQWRKFRNHREHLYCWIALVHTSWSRSEC